MRQFVLILKHFLHLFRNDEGQQTLDDFIRLCISDPAFASYVGKVEAALGRITNAHTIKLQNEKTDNA